MILVADTEHCPYSITYLLNFHRYLDLGAKIDYSRTARETLQRTYKKSCHPT